MSKILVIEDEDIIQKFLSSIAKEKIFTISDVKRNLLQYDNIILNTESYEVLKKGERIELTTKEYQILKLFMQNPNKVFTKEDLLERIWKYEFAGDEQIIYTHIKNIRKKLGEDVIKNVRGIGYKI